MNIKRKKRPPDNRATRQQRTKTKRVKIAILVFPFLLFLLIPVFYQLAYWQKIYPGISIAQMPVGNLTKKEAQLVIQQALTQKKPRVLKLVWNSQSWEVDLEELALVYQPEKTTNKAYHFGRRGSLWKNLQDRHQAWTKGKNLPLDYSLNHSLLEEKIATLSAQIFIPTIPPSLQLNKQTKRVVVEPGNEGQQLETGKLVNLIDFQLANLINTPIALPIKKTSLSINQEALVKSKARAEQFLSKKLKLQAPGQVFEIKGEEFLPFISFENDFNEEKIKDYVSQLASLINQTAQDALFRFEKGRVIVFRPSKKGTLIDQTKTLQLIKEGLKELEKSEKKEKTIKLPTRLIEPEIKIGDINRFGIREKIGQGRSRFRGSTPSRTHNIKLASARLSGILVPPGGVFSFNQSLGEVSETTGFKPAYIIKQGRTVLGDGGGVCQVSTTLFRAILNAGLPVLERHPHAYRVSYYEQDSQPGFDATVFDPTADLKFKNDTPAYLLVQANVDTQDKTLVFELYGTNDGRKVTISKTRVWDQVPPPPDLYQDDPTLPTGTLKQIDWKAWGAKVAFDWKVTRNGQILQNRTFYSHYQPWQAVYLRGTGSVQS